MAAMAIPAGKRIAVISSGLPTTAATMATARPTERNTAIHTSPNRVKAQKLRKQA